MRIDVTTEPGDPQHPNEDYASVALPASGRGGALVLLDGVTPPEDEAGCTHGVPWFTARLGGALLELSGSRRDMTLASCLADAIRRAADAHSGVCDLSHARTPQATVVAVRWDDAVVEHLVLSDSVLLIEAADGTVTPVLDDRLHRLPDSVRALGATARSLPRGSAERAAARAEYGRAVESLRNATGGFFTAAADPEVARLAVTGSTPRSDVRALAALTDGAARWTEVFRKGDWAACLSVLRGAGTRALVTAVREAEAADPEGETYPRGKARDDASVVFAEL
ncbi:hypothetical protein ABT112_16330 [Streptomyces sp. NPDC002055]|uniref:hypothetical protein n=1 Tax=Streptomyces sp. NPDC002055 TaxID=3154534 RepID=UPI00333081D4